MLPYFHGPTFYLTLTDEQKKTGLFDKDFVYKMTDWLKTYTGTKVKLSKRSQKVNGMTLFRTDSEQNL